MSLPELFGNNYSTTLNGSITNSQTVITVNSAPPTSLIAPGQFRALIGSEYLLASIPFNLVSNPSFETNTTGWQTSGADLVTPSTLTRVAGAVGPSGSWSGQVVTTNATTFQGVAFPLPQTYFSGVTYTVSVYLKGNAGGEAVQVLIDGAGDIGLSSVTLTTSAVRYSLQWTPSANRVNPTLYIRSNAAAAYTFLIDCVQITQTPSAVSYSDTATGLDWSVIRGVEGSTAASQTNGAQVTHIVTAAAIGGQSDANAGVPALRTLGQGVQQAAPGTSFQGAGHTNIPTTETFTQTSYNTAPTPDQVSNVVLPASGLIAIWYQATWQESALNVARAAIFLNSNQVKIAGVAAGPVTQAAVTGPGQGSAAQDEALFTGPWGLFSTAGAPGAYTGDVTTGQIIGGTGKDTIGLELNGVQNELTDATIAPLARAAIAGPCYIFAAAGTYTVSVRFKSPGGGSITVKNRQLWVGVIPFP